MPTPSGSVRVIAPLGWMALLWLQSSKTWPQASPWLVQLAAWLPGWLALDKLIHAGLYAVLAALWLWARPGKPSQALALASLYGAVDEWHQSWVPGRSADAWDWLADTAGASLVLALQRVRNAAR